MLLSVIIVSYNTKELLQQCLKSIQASLGKSKPQNLKPKTQKSQLSFANLEVIIVDNNSTDGTQEYLTKLKATKVQSLNSKTQINPKSQFLNIKTILNKENAGFSKANNQGTEKAIGKYVLFLNPDTIIYRNTLDKTINYLAAHKDVGLVTCRIELADGSFQKECHRGFPNPWRSFCHFSGLDKIFPKSKLFAGYFLGHLPKDTTHEIDACVGAFIMAKKEVGDRINWWDEDFFWYGEDLDLCYRVKKAGFKVIFYPKVKITHYQGASSGIKKTKSRANKETRKKVMRASTEAMRIFYQKHYQKKYPKLISFFVMVGINLLEKIRLASVEKQFR